MLRYLNGMQRLRTRMVMSDEVGEEPMNQTIFRISASGT